MTCASEVAGERAFNAYKIKILGEASGHEFDANRLVYEADAYQKKRVSAVIRVSYELVLAVSAFSERRAKEQDCSKCRQLQECKKSG